MFKLSRKFVRNLKCSQKVFDSHVLKTYYFNTNLQTGPSSRLISGSSILRQSTASEAACPAHTTQEKVEDDWSSRCHVDKATWDNAKPFDEMPGIRKTPIIGSTWRFLPGGEFYKLDVYQFMDKLKSKYGGISRVEGILGLQDSIFTMCPEHTEQVYKQEAFFPSRDILGSMTYFRANFRQDIFKDAKGLLTSNGQDWYDFRNKVNKIMMQPKVIKQYIKPVDEIALEFVDKVKRTRHSDGTIGDIMNETNKWALESIAYMALDQRLGCMADNLAPDSIPQKMVTNAERIFQVGELLDFRPNIWRYVSTPTYRKAMKLYDEQITIAQIPIAAAMNKINEKKKGNNLNEDEGEKSVLEKLWDIDPKVATVMVSDMLLAGIDTTSTAFVNILYQLSKNPDKQEILRDEINSILQGNESDSITAEQLSHMPYLKACIKEAGRIYPVTPGTMRNLTKDTVIAGYQVPKGTKIFLTHMYLSVLEDQFPRPLEYIPERWLRENNSELSYKNAHPFCTMQFGFGARSCIGRRFADLELELATVNFVRNFSMKWKGPPPKQVTTSINYLKGPFGFIFNDLKS